MAGSIRRVFPNTLSYSCDFSSPLNSDRGDSFSPTSSSNGDASSINSSMVFDLRDDIENESLGNALQLHELNSASESAIALEASPDNITFLPPSDTLNIEAFSSSPEDTYESKSVKVSDLVDCLVGPSLMPALSQKTVRSSHSTKPSSTATSGVSTPKEKDSKPVLAPIIPKVFPIGRTPPKKPSRRSHTNPKPLVAAPERKDSTFIPFDQVVGKSIKTNPSFSCPDGWLPNHQCDDFCLSLFSGSRPPQSTAPRQQRRQFTPFSK